MSDPAFSGEDPVVEYDKTKYDHQPREGEEGRWSEAKAQLVSQTAKSQDRFGEISREDNMISGDMQRIQTLRDLELLRRAGTYPQKKDWATHEDHQFADYDYFEPNLPSGIANAEGLLKRDRESRDEAIEQFSRLPEELYNSNPEKYKDMTAAEFMEAFAEYKELKFAVASWLYTAEELGELLGALRLAKENNSPKVPSSILLHPDVMKIGMPHKRIMLLLSDYVEGSIDQYTVSPADRIQRLLDACNAASTEVVKQTRAVQARVQAILHPEPKPVDTVEQTNQPSTL